MEKFKRIDSFDVTFADSFARPEYKVREIKHHIDGRQAKKGIGEKRIYCGHDEAELNKFFAFAKNPVFFLQKDDLEEYMSSIEKEFLDPTYNYGEGVRETYKLFLKYQQKIKALKEPRLYLHFTATYDKQNRYYLVLPKRKKENLADHINYDYLRDICLPRVTRLLFVKLLDLETEQIYIYIKPFFGTRDITEVKRSNTKKDSKEVRQRGRKGQDKYREAIFAKYPYCVVTKVTDPNLLIACHIKGFADCNSKEQFDEFNGFTMTPTIHTLFDLGYLTFDNNGKMVLSDFFRNMDRKNLHLNGTIRVTIHKESIKYLEWHNSHTFMRTSIGVDIVAD
ncbi:MAG: HNH endonuclease signature motif containing protein [Muribaculaceae bacterium]